jgi:hypothetical protein
MTWDNISIEQFAELQATFKDKPDNAVDKLNQKILQVSIITGKDLEEVEKMTLDDLKEIEDLLHSPLPTKIHKRFTVGGVVYRFMTNPNELTAGEYMSIMEAAKDNPFEALHRIMFDIARPIKLTLKGWKDYELEDHEIADRIEDFKKMPISVANPIAVFFCRLSKDLTSALVDYSHKELQKQTERMKKMEKEIQDELRDLQDGVG